MRLTDVRGEIGAALATIDGLRVFPYGTKRVTPPAAIVGFPEPISYDATLARGMDSMTVPVLIVVGDLDAEASSAALGAYLDGSGPSSVKAAVDGGTYTACDSARVTEARVDPVSIAGIPYLAAVVDVAVYGQGRN